MKLIEFLQKRGIRPYSSVLSSQWGVTKQHLGDIAKGKKHPSFRLAQRIEALTEGAVTVRDWLPETAEPSEGPPFDESLPVEPEPAPVSLSPR